MRSRLRFPDGRRFAFTIIDDTDVATVENVEPVYRLLDSLGMRTTKTVWPVGCPEGSRNFSSSQTLEDGDYLAFVRSLAARGFEITWHGATMESSERTRTIAALERFRELFGSYPRVHANHAYNRENMYWGPSRLDDAVLKSLAARWLSVPPGGYGGHVRESPYWWGDLCERHIDYMRNLTFTDIDLLRVNPSMPYHDPRRPHVRWWFSAVDAEDRASFNDVLQPHNQERLEREGGICIIATHFGKGFTQEGKVHPVTEQRLRLLAGRPGWFPNVGTLLDWLRDQRGTDELPAREWRGMQWQWALDLIRRKLQHRRAAAVA